MSKKIEQNKEIEKSDFQGLAQLITDATIGITDLVEAVHTQVVNPPFLPSTPIQTLISKIAGFTFDNIKLSTKLIGSGTDKALGRLAFVLGNIKSTEKSEAVRSVLNGVIGDYLVEKDNPLRIKMQFKHNGESLELTKKSLKKTAQTINGKILLMVHGSCMNNTQWTRKEHNHGIKLAEELDKTPLFLLYNSGQHISTNGQELNILLEELFLNWPVPVEELTVLNHSMGGLVFRSALHYGKKQKRLWTEYLKKVVFLGTPHHGAPMEKAGNFVDVVLESIPYAKPFARLGKIRSAGVTDLRYGNILDEDWQNKDRFELTDDQRKRVSLPIDVDCYSIAGIASKETSYITSQLLGDNLVRVESALGLHKDSKKTLKFKKKNTWIAYECNHLDLLSKPEVYAKIKSWMGKLM